MQAISKHTTIGLPWELLYADDLAIAAETEMNLNDRMNAWKSCLESKGLKVIISKTKVMCVRNRFTFQKLAEKSIHLFLTNEKYAKHLMDHKVEPLDLEGK